MEKPQKYAMTIRTTMYESTSNQMKNVLVAIAGVYVTFCNIKFNLATMKNAEKYQTDKNDYLKTLRYYVEFTATPRMKDTILSTLDFPNKSIEVVQCDIRKKEEPKFVIPNFTWDSDGFFATNILQFFNQPDVSEGLQIMYLSNTAKKISTPDITMKTKHGYYMYRTIYLMGLNCAFTPSHQWIQQWNNDEESMKIMTMYQPNRNLLSVVSDRLKQKYNFLKWIVTNGSINNMKSIPKNYDHHLGLLKIAFERDPVALKYCGESEDHIRWLCDILVQKPHVYHILTPIMRKNYLVNVTILGSKVGDCRQNQDEIVRPIDCEKDTMSFHRGIDRYGFMSL